MPFDLLDRMPMVQLMRQKMGPDRLRDGELWRDVPQNDLDEGMKFLNQARFDDRHQRRVVPNAQNGIPEYQYDAQRARVRNAHPLADETVSFAAAVLALAVLARGWVWYGRHVTHRRTPTAAAAARAGVGPLAQASLAATLRGGAAGAGAAAPRGVPTAMPTRRPAAAVTDAGEATATAAPKTRAAAVGHAAALGGKAPAEAARRRGDAAPWLPDPMELRSRIWAMRKNPIPWHTVFKR